LWAALIKTTWKNHPKELEKQISSPRSIHISCYAENSHKIAEAK